MQEEDVPPVKRTPKARFQRLRELQPRQKPKGKSPDDEKLSFKKILEEKMGIIETLPADLQEDLHLVLNLIALDYQKLHDINQRFHQFTLDLSHHYFNLPTKSAEYLESLENKLEMTFTLFFYLVYEYGYSEAMHSLLICAKDLLGSKRMKKKASVFLLQLAKASPYALLAFRKKFAKFQKLDSLAENKTYILKSILKDVLEHQFPGKQVASILKTFNAK